MDEMEIKEVYTLFGLTVYLIQCFERQLAITLATVCLSDSDAVSREQYDALLGKNFKKTLGQLFHRMKDDIQIVTEVKKKVDSMLEFITKEWGKKRGVTEQDYAEELEKLLKLDNAESMKDKPSWL